MKVIGIVIHQSACSAINGKGYDFFITKTGGIIPASEPVDPDGRLHVCLEGDFSSPEGIGSREAEEQFFVAAKLIGQLSAAFDFSPAALTPHRDGCPGAWFPWGKLVLSISDGYH
jgi:hypothetical protein